jgi:hypothetical protein
MPVNCNSVTVEHYISGILTSRLIRCFINTNESVAEFEHVVSKGDNYELSVLRPVLDVVRDYRDISEVKSGINLIHEV